MTKRSILYTIFGVVVFLVVSVWFFYEVVPSWFWHPLGYCSGTALQIRNCKGYNSWSGSFSDIGEATLVVGLITGSIAVHRFIHKHFECHKDTCHRIGVHPVHGTPFRTCWHHHPVLAAHEKGAVSLETIHQAHADAHPLPPPGDDRDKV